MKDTQLQTNVLILRRLQGLGLSEREALVYTVLNQTGTLSVQDLGRRTSIPRPSLYPILNELIARGLVAQELRNRRRRFSALSPSVFGEIIEREEQALSARREVVKSLEELLFMNREVRPDVSPKVFFFEGKKQIEQMLYHFQPAWRTSYRRLGLFTMWGYQDHTFVEQYRRWHDQAWKTRDPREEIKLFSSVEGQQQQSQEKIARREIRGLPQGLDFTSSIWIHGDYVVLANTRTRTHYATVQIDPNLSANLRQLFQTLWKLTDPGSIAISQQKK